MSVHDGSVKEEADTVCNTSVHDGSVKEEVNTVCHTSVHDVGE